MKDSPLKTKLKNGGKKLTLKNEASLKITSSEKNDNSISKLQDDISPNNSTPKVKSNTDVKNKCPAKVDIDVEENAKNCPSLQDYLKRILKSLQKLDVRGFFANPVNVSEAPGYLTIIKTPMDFSTMRKKLKSLEYNSIEEMETDFCLMIKNCLRYNSKETVYHKVASKMFDKGFLIINEVASAMEESLKLTPNDQNVKEKKYKGRSKRSINYSDEEESLKLTPNDQNVKEKKYKSRSKRSINYSEEEEISETEEEEEDDINVHKNKLKIMDGNIEPNLKNKISEKEEIVIDERKLTEKVTNKDSIKNSEQRKLTRKVKREEILQRKLTRKMTREEVLPVSKTRDSEDNLSARESKKGN